MENSAASIKPAKMADLIRIVSDEATKDNSKLKDAGKSILATGLLNLLTIPFGFTSVRVVKSESSEQMQSRISNAVFGPEISKLTGRYEDYCLFLDQIDGARKIKIINFAVTKPKEFRSWVIANFN